MAFLKLKCDTAYATGAIRSNLDLPHLIAKLKRTGLGAHLTNGRLLVRCGDETWEFGDWQADGVGRIGWAKMRLLGDAGTLSRHLAQAGIRHKFEYSRPRDLETNDVRCVTRYDYRWDTPGLPPRSAVTPDVSTFDEQL